MGGGARGAITMYKSTLLFMWKTWPWCDLYHSSLPYRKIHLKTSKVGLIEERYVQLKAITLPSFERFHD